ncbi:MAG: hypothetical protein A2X13_06810 [Bacteroidetes bacterium GWC2_33_15]|nr:MAG: hypothetical protein A2X10_02240 [Bacteroidetes bacterium GWA2_33_15]OFX52493.1 MAG: hypothetical protein A2X13_06810 [Bacteroidetes bacterium GWC2_33_15]OFX65554.1 MAG: hypothetical protein A2X15_14925 [Bacteroidetes bacterium GWB2_32_14]OFX67575.1 MAG: hypothetical protein A2X14_11645 [Bacteroidetes bacterium GWD2_33_33]HAN18380.1 hypothetical protein [Bacteroidales bacterium]
MFDKKILNIYSVIIGVLFIVSGLGKVVNTAGFSELISNYGLSYFKYLSPVIVLVEILIGLFLVLLINPKRYSFISFCLLIVFTLAFAYAYFKHGINNCGCFGTLKYASTSPVISFVRNFILITMSLIIWIKYPKEKTEPETWKKDFVLYVMCFSLFAAGYSFRGPINFKLNLKKQPYLNQPLNNTILSKYVKTSPDSTYLVFCFSYTCPHCLNSIENLNQYKHYNTVDSIIAFTTGKESDKLFFEQNFKANFKITTLPKESLFEIADVVPTAYYIKNDTIKAIIPTVLPSHVVFKKHYLRSKSN